MKKVLMIYPSMLMGGSTTALLSFLNNLSPEKYSIDLQLFRNEGVLLDSIPEHVNLLPCAELHTGFVGRIVKMCKFLLSGYAFKAWKSAKAHKLEKLDGAVVSEFQAKLLSRKNHNKYDYAISFLEGWSDWYLGFGVKNADVKYGWLHSTYSEIALYPDSELPWLKNVDKVAFVTDACRIKFCEALPDMADKTVVVENITDSSIIKQRAAQKDMSDPDYLRFSEYEGFKIVTVCRLEMYTKGLDRIIETVKKLKADNKEFLWYIVGDGNSKDALMANIKESGIEDCLILTGKKFNPYPYIEAADIMCMPSRYEGKPMVITEGFILCTPPVVTEYLSANEQIENGIDGIVVSNDDDSVYPAVKKLMDNKEEVAKLCNTISAREYGNADAFFDIEKMLFDKNCF